MLFYYRDNRNIGSKKVDHKENVTTNAMGRSMSFSLKQESKESIQSAQTNTILDNNASCVAVGVIDPLNAALSPKNSVKNCPVEVVSSITNAQHPTPKKDPLLGLPSRSSPLKDCLKIFSVASREGEDCMAQQEIVGAGSLKLLNTKNTSDVLVKCSLDRNCNEDADSVGGKDSMNLVTNLPTGRAHMNPKKDLDEVIAMSSCTLQRSHDVTLVKEDSGKVYIFFYQIQA